MFQGFTDETFEFFMAIAFNNNTDFFHANHDWYLRAVREPCLSLAAALSDAVEAIDPDLERRPNRVVSRISRDLRFSRDKSPYRDYMWLSYHHGGEDRHSTPGFYFEITARGASCGMGFYEEHRARMNGLRRRLQTEPEEMLSRWSPLRDDHALHVNGFKRMKIPEGLDPELQVWYPVRSFWLDHDLSDPALLRSSDLVDVLSEGFQRLAPLYHYIMDIPPETDEDNSRVDRDNPDQRMF